MNWKPIKDAPRDGTMILARYHNDVCYDYRLVWWHPDGESDCYPWKSEFNAYPEARCEEWASLD